MTLTGTRGTAGIRVNDETTTTKTKTETNKKEWIRGVNLGGWLVLERFITPYFFALTTCHINGDFRFYPHQIDAPPTTSPLYKSMPMPINLNPDLDPDLLSNNSNVTTTTTTTSSSSSSVACQPILPYPVDEWTLTSSFPDPNIAKQYLQIHYENFVKREDITKLRQNGVTHVRVPLGHWILEHDDDTLTDPHPNPNSPNVVGPKKEPYVSGGWPYFLRLVQWCREEGIQVWPDIHTAPGSQNGFDNSGHTLPIPTCHGWDMDNSTATTFNSSSNNFINGLSSNAWKSLQAITNVTKAISKYNLTDVVTGFGILNEPFVNCDMTEMRKFDNLAYDIVRKNMGEQTSIYIGDMFNSSLWNDGWWTDDKYKGTYLDSHYYHVFDERPRGMSPRQHIALVCQKNHRETIGCCYDDEEKMTIPSSGISRIVGEWSASFDTLVFVKLDDVMDAIHKTGVALEFDRQISPERQDFLRHFVEAQMVAYEAQPTGVSEGWFYWTFKMEGGAFAEWDFLRGIEEGWMPPIPPPNVNSMDLYGTCEDIIFKTKDDMSIVHEFPDKSSLDLSNWQGFPIDDDVVVSHGASLLSSDDNDDDNASAETKGEVVIYVIGSIALFLIYWTMCRRRGNNTRTSGGGYQELK